MPRFACDFSSVTIFSEVEAPRPSAVAGEFDKILQEIEERGHLSELFPISPKRRKIECPHCKGLGELYVANAQRPSRDTSS